MHAGDGILDIVLLDVLKRSRVTAPPRELTLECFEDLVVGEITLLKVPYKFVLISSKLAG